MGYVQTPFAIIGGDPIVLYKRVEDAEMRSCEGKLLVRPLRSVTEPFGMAVRFAECG